MTSGALTTNHKVALIFPELSYNIAGIGFKAQNTLGRFAKEKQYCDLLEKLFQEKGLKCVREFTLSETGNRVDFIVEDLILLEIKAKPFLTKDNFDQVKRYLTLLDLELGLLINFQSKYLKVERVINVRQNFATFKSSNNS